MARRIRAVVSCVSSRLLRDGIRPLPRGGERRVHRPRVSASAARQDASGVCLLGCRRSDRSCQRLVSPPRDDTNGSLLAWSSHWHRPVSAARDRRNHDAVASRARRLRHRRSSGAHCGRVFWVVNVAPRSTRGGPRCESDSAEGAAAVIQS